MKSLRDEIRLRRVKRTDLISSSAKCSISSEGFARRFHRGAPQGPRNELAEFWGKGQCLDFAYHTILRLNNGCSAPAEMCFSQVRYRYLHQKVVGSAYEQHPQPRRRSRIERNHIPINARGGEINSPPHSLMNSLLSQSVSFPVVLSTPQTRVFLLRIQRKRGCRASYG